MQDLFVSGLGWTIHSYQDRAELCRFTGEELSPDVAAVVAACLAVLRLTPSAVVTDIDGTISAIAPTPAEAMVDATAKAALALLAKRAGGRRRRLRPRP